jgi:hypothetical protein
VKTVFGELFGDGGTDVAAAAGDERTFEFVHKSVFRVYDQRSAAANGLAVLVLQFELIEF